MQLGAAESFSLYGACWANASNTPFRRYKHWVHEGGAATPLVAHWPAKIAPELGEMIVLYDAWAKRALVEPWGKKRKKPGKKPRA